MQNALTKIDNVLTWVKDHESFIWTLYSSDKKTILARNESTTDEKKSMDWLKRELENRSLYGGTYALYINDKKGNGGEWSDIIIPPQTPNNQMAGINGSGFPMPYGVNSIQEYVDKEFEYRETKKRLAELEAGIGQSEKFWQRQIDKLTEHPEFDPNTTVLAIGGLASRVVNILEIAFGVNGSKATPLLNQNDVAQTRRQPINGVPPKQHEPQPNANTEEKAEVKTEAPTEGVGSPDEEIIYDGDTLAEVCDDLIEIYPDKKPEEVLLVLKNLIKNDPNTAAMVRKMAKF